MHPPGKTGWNRILGYTAIRLLLGNRLIRVYGYFSVVGIYRPAHTGVRRWLGTSQRAPIARHIGAPLGIHHTPPTLCTFQFQLKHLSMASNSIYVIWHQEMLARKNELLLARQNELMHSSNSKTSAERTTGETIERCVSFSIPTVHRAQRYTLSKKALVEHDRNHDSETHNHDRHHRRSPPLSRTRGQRTGRRCWKLKGASYSLSLAMVDNDITRQGEHPGLATEHVQLDRYAPTSPLSYPGPKRKYRLQFVFQYLQTSEFSSHHPSHSIPSYPCPLPSYFCPSIILFFLVHLL